MSVPNSPTPDLQTHQAPRHPGSRCQCTSGAAAPHTHSRRRPSPASRVANADKYGDFNWDDERNDAAITAAQKITAHQIIWGGNYYDLGPCRGYLVWNKLNSGDFADCELAWTNLDQAVRKIDLLWNGMIRAEKHIERVHPTQKPVGVMQFCLDQLPSDAHTVFDPFMGSGTTGVACVQSRKAFIGIEREPSYFDMACQRIQDAVNQPNLFNEKPPEPEPVHAELATEEEVEAYIQKRKAEKEKERLAKEAADAAAAAEKAGALFLVLSVCVFLYIQRESFFFSLRERKREYVESKFSNCFASDTMFVRYYYHEQR